MHHRPRRPTPPWDRIRSHPQHPLGRARRRWPRAYDGPDPVEQRVPERYRRVHDAEVRTERRRRWQPTPRRGSLELLRQNPLRNGLIGLAVAGTTAPIAVNHYQQAMRTDPAHEDALAASAEGSAGSDDLAVSQVWQEMTADDAARSSDREELIRSKIDQYAAYGLDRQLAERIYDMAAANSIDPEIAYGLVRAESSFKNSSTSTVGAIGLTQLMPSTASWLQPGVTRGELRDPETNLRIGFRYLRQLIDKYDGNTDLALLAYNRGPGTVDRELKRGRNPDNGYADFVRGKEGHGHRLFTSR